MQALQQLRSALDELHHELSREELEQKKRHMVSLLDTAEALNGTLVPANGNGNGNGHEAPHGRLSRREREVMSMLLQGQRLKEIAAHLNISVKTVTTHRSRLMKKLHVEDNLGLYRYGIRNGLIGL